MLVCASIVSIVSCGGRSSSEAVPTAALAESRGAQEAFRPLKQRFVASGRADRAALWPNLTWFVATYPKDGLAGLARLFLALIALDRGDIDAARRFEEQAAVGASGTPHDLAQLLEGAILLRQNATAQAFERFMPLIGKLIDPYTRMLLDENLVAAAIAAHRWYEAIAYMDLWSRDATEESSAGVRREVKKSLEAIPVEALELMLQAMRADAARSSYGLEIKRALVARLAEVALEHQDTGLAKRLVESTGTAQSLGDATEGLEELASSGGAPSIDGRTIGLLVSTGQNRLGHRAAEVLSGVVDALRLTGDEKDGVRLTTRDERDPTRTELGLLALASQGASVLIAGLDAGQAKVAARFAERTHVPVILLSALGSGVDPVPPAFSLGEGSDKVSLVLTAALASRGARTIAPIGGAAPEGSTRVRFVEAISCTAEPVQVGASLLPVEAWRAARVDALLFLGDGACASQVMATAADPKSGWRIAIGLEAAEIAVEPTRAPLLVATAGAFPLRRGDVASPMAGYQRRHGKPPTFAAALGHDAAVLARAAARSLPLDRTEDPAEVDKRQRTVAGALGAVEADLWSTAARGFAAQASIARDVAVIEVK